MFSRLKIIKALQSKSQTTKFISFPSPLHSHSKTPSSLSTDLLSHFSKCMNITLLQCLKLSYYSLDPRMLYSFLKVSKDPN